MHSTSFTSASMGIRLHLLLLALVALLASCTQTPPEGAAPRTEPPHAISHLTVSASECFGRCPTWAMEMDSALDVIYWGEGYAKVQGLYRGHVPRHLWDSLCTQLDMLGYAEMDTHKRYADDAQHYEFVISHHGGQETRFNRYTSLEGDSLAPLVLAMYEAVPRLNLHPTPDSLRFRHLSRQPFLLEHGIIEFKVPEPLAE